MNTDSFKRKEKRPDSFGRRECDTDFSEKHRNGAGIYGKKEHRFRKSATNSYETDLLEEEKALALKKELYAYQETGTRLSLNGRYASPERIVKACMLGEPQDYMRDYISDEGTKINRIDFTRIRDK